MGAEHPRWVCAAFPDQPFLDTLGPFYQREEGDGIRVAEGHLNARGAAHGGLVVTMADVALGYNASFVGVRKRAGAAPTALLTTANLSVDFPGGARLGDWVDV